MIQIQLKKIIKILVLSLFVGLLMGVISSFFLSALHTVTTLRENHPELLLGLPFLGLLTAYIYHHFGKESKKGNNLIIESIHKETNVPFRMAFLTLFFTILTHLFGGSVGREGTGVQIGGTLSHQISNIFKLDKEDQRILVMAGISAGFGSVFGTPLAGAFFGIEMAFVGKLSFEALLPCLIASYSASYITALLGITHSHYVIQGIPNLSVSLLLVVIGSSVLFGWVASTFSRTVHWIKEVSSKLIASYLWRAFVGSLVVVVLMGSLNATRFGGLSTWLIQAGFEGSVSLFDPFLKFLFTVLSLGSGLQGGEVTPLFAIGSSLGGLIGQLTDIEPSLLAALGLIAVFGAAANTPYTTILLGCELFGVQALPFFCVTVLISYTASGHHGIYFEQIIHRSKRPSLAHQQGKSLRALNEKP